MAEHQTPSAAPPPSLKGAAWLKRPETVRVLAALSGEGIETRAVGGAVRDALLGLEVTDIDFATTAVPETVMSLARKAGLKAIPTGLVHGTVTIVADEVPFEVTTLRRDVETFAGFNPDHPLLEIPPLAAVDRAHDDFGIGQSIISHRQSLASTEKLPAP